MKKKIYQQYRQKAGSRKLRDFCKKVIDGLSIFVKDKGLDYGEFIKIDDLEKVVLRIRERKPSKGL